MLTDIPKAKVACTERRLLAFATDVGWFRRSRLPIALIVVAVFLGSAPAGARVIAAAGSGAGQVERPAGVTVDQGTGTVYVADENNNRIDEFTRGGAFVRAFGFGVRDGANKLEVCTAETTCRQGLFGEGPGEVKPVGIAADATTHDVYVSDHEGHRIERYTESGAFVAMFGEGVDKGPTNPGNVCTAAFVKEGDVCGFGVASTGPGGFSSIHGLPIGVDASGNVWVGDQSRIEKFSAAGLFLEEVSLPGAEGLESLGVDTLGEFFILSSSEEAIRKLNAKGGQLFAVDVPPGRPRALILGGANGLFVGDDTGMYHFIQFDAATGVEEEVFGAGNVVSRPNKERQEGDVLGFDGMTGTIYAASASSGAVDPTGAGEISAVIASTVPAPGPLQRELQAEKIRGTRATLGTVLNPEGAETEYEFQYVDDATFKAESKGHEFDQAATTPPLKLAASFAEVGVNALAEGLSSETLYHFRIVAHNAHGNVQTAEGAVEAGTFKTVAAVEIDAAYVTAVTPDSATLNASINPEGVPSTYRFEYLPAAAYQANLEAARPAFTGAAVTPAPDGSLGKGEASVNVSNITESLTPATAYRFRVVGSNAGGAGASAPKAFTTWPAGRSQLLDGREWELVSPLEKQGGLFEPIGEAGMIQAAAGGGGLTYLATRPTEAQPEGYLTKEQLLSERTPAGWQTHGLSLPHETAPGVSIGKGEEYRFFSEDLTTGIAQPFGVFDPTVSEQASEDTPLLRSNFLGEGVSTPCVAAEHACYRPLVVGCPPAGQECRASVEAHANVPPGTRFGIDTNTLEPCTHGFCGVQFVGASADARHVILESAAVGLTGATGDHGGLYEWAEGQLSLVSVLPNGTPAGFVAISESPELGRRNPANAATAVSRDGSRVEWSFGGHLYQRDLHVEKTVQLDAPGSGAGGKPSATEPKFQGASADGTVVFFSDEQKLMKEASPSVDKPDLYRCVLVDEAGKPRCNLSDLTPGANIQGGMLGVSTDGSYGYFVADGILAAGAEPGDCSNVGAGWAPHASCNLYGWHEGAINLVARLSGEDFADWRAEFGRSTGRVSPNGKWLEFMSEVSLTGYENTDARSGKPDEEVFLYSAAMDGGVGGLTCASCNPSGARPDGAVYPTKPTLTSGDRIWDNPNRTWLAASVPGWTSYKSGNPLYQSRYLSDSGRIFFNSHDALSASDTNGTEDVYEFESAGVGTCTTGSGSFSVANSGCVNLVTSGTSPTESAFLDASESGADVFFLTAAALTAGDKDQAVDVYDAHVCQAADPCPVPTMRTEGCSGEACQAEIAAPAEPSPSSLLVSSLGNVPPLPTVQPPAKPKLTAAQRLARALKACRRKHARRVRRTCEARARHEYRVARRKASGAGRATVSQSPRRSP